MSGGFERHAEFLLKSKYLGFFVIWTGSAGYIGYPAINIQQNGVYFYNRLCLQFSAVLVLLALLLANLLNNKIC